MTHIKALKLARDAIFLANISVCNTDEHIRTYLQAIAAIDAALALTPDAWGIKNRDGLYMDVICPAEHDREAGDYIIPLFAGEME